MNWHPKIGDPTPMGWITVLVYFVTSLTTFIVALKSKNDKTNHRFWSFLAVFLLLLLQKASVFLFRKKDI